MCLYLHVCDIVQLLHGMCVCVDVCDILQMSHGLTLQWREEAQDRSVSCVSVTVYKCRTV